MQVRLFVCVLLLELTGASRVIIVENAKTCYRRVLAGRRALRNHVRRIIPCERLEDCQRECAEERRFHCESFNYRLDTSFRGKGLCELMSKPIEHFDVRRDFVDDRNFDFYELDRNSRQPECVSTWKGPPIPHSGFLGGSSSYGGQGHDRWKPTNWRPEHHYRPPTHFRPDHNLRPDPIDYRPGEEDWSYHDSGYSRDNYRNNRRGYRDHVRNFIPYQIGTARSDDDCEHSQYGGQQYYNDRSDYKNSLDYWGIDNSVPASHPNENEFNYYNLGNRRYNVNHWNSYFYGYGNKNIEPSPGVWTPNEDSTGLAYGESSYYRKPPTDNFIEQGPQLEYDCSSRRRSGMSLSTGAIRRSLVGRSILDCEAACFRETSFKCVSYSYRYSTSHGTENCFLSETPYRGLQLDTDSGSDVYSMEEQKRCGGSRTPWVESECFLHLRSGKTLPREEVSAALVVAGLGACEAECIRARGFFCRGFSFRFDPPTIGEDSENCLLTSHPPGGLLTLRPAPGHELYARGNYGRGCEPSLAEPPVIVPQHTHTKCYLQYDNSARLRDSAARGRAKVQDEASCARACTGAPFPCLSFSYSTSHSSEDNCLLSEIKLNDLQLGVDYQHSPHDWLFSFDVFNSNCWRKHPPHGLSIDRSELPRPIQPLPDDRPTGPTGPVTPPHHIYPIPSGAAYPTGPELPVYGTAPARPILPEYPGNVHPISPPIPEYSAIPSGSPYPIARPDPARNPPGYLPEHEISGPPSGPGFTPGYRPGPIGPSGGPGYLPDKDIHGVDDQFPISWRHYTVSGLPCRRATTCAQNRVSGHFSCEPEGGEVGAWDYCCAPNHRCGYSEGFHKPWCYVGPSKDQWRPCSEKYYPYHHHNIPHPSHDHREDHTKPTYSGHLTSGPDTWKPDHSNIDHFPGPDSYLPYEEHAYRKPEFKPSPYLPEADRKYWDDLYKNGPQAFYDEHGNPLPGYTRVPPDEQHHFGPSHSWVPVGVEEEQFLEPPLPGGLGVARYWPVAYLHKGPPPNMTYFNYREKQIPSSTERYDTRTKLPNGYSNTTSKEFTPKITENRTSEDAKQRSREGNEKMINMTTSRENVTEITTMTNDVKPKDTKGKVTELPEKDKKMSGIHDKLEDFMSEIEVLNIEDAKIKSGEKFSDVKTLEAEERQIEEIGRLLASRRNGEFSLEKRSNNPQSHNIKVAKGSEYEELKFNSKLVPVTSSKIERIGIVQRVNKDYIDTLKTPKYEGSLEIGESGYPKTNDSEIKKAYIKGQIFYDAMIKDSSKSPQKPQIVTKSNDKINDDNIRNQNERKTTEREQKFIKVPLVEPKTGSLQLPTFGERSTKTKNVSPIRRARRLYRRRYDPQEVRKRLLEKEKSKEEN